ncbi:hypothetical protein AMECASPLE_015865 [Ameca splendens]|uniref:Uncharacterized protein n=1 Tax=Ameca splendens TaxID=208324 RepID=A0ABV0YDZ3_9TELE
MRIMSILSPNEMMTPRSGIIGTETSDCFPLPGLNVHTDCYFVSENQKRVCTVHRGLSTLQRGEQMVPAA